MIERIVALLTDPRLGMDTDDIADALWLALQIEIRSLEHDKHKQIVVANNVDSTQKADVQDQRILASGETVEPAGTPDAGEGKKYLHPDATQQPVSKSFATMRGVSFRVPGASALPASREIAKALRPLMRHYPSRTQYMFDEQSTVQQIADERIAQIGRPKTSVTGLWHIQFQPARERWFDVELVADSGKSMVLWWQSIAEFHHLLTRHGAFRRVRAWSLNTDAYDDQVVLYPGLANASMRQPVRNPRELLTPNGRRLILVVTDCVSPGWHAGLVSDLLGLWGTHHPVALVQVLPERLWSGSTLRSAPTIQIHVQEPDSANARLRYTFLSRNKRSPSRSDVPAQRITTLPVPMLTLDGAQMAAWARLVTGTGITPVNGFLMTCGADKTVPSSLPEGDVPPEQLVSEFRTYASPEAFRLAQVLAAAPLSLPVIRLVQRTMMPRARQSHIAEVFLSGLLRRRTPDNSEYNFN